MSTTEIKVRDNMGREFSQKAIPEWKPFYCRKCHKLGHECKEPQPNTSIEEGKTQRTQKMWVPTSIAKLMKGVTCVEDLKNKFEKDQDRFLEGNKHHSNTVRGEEVDSFEKGENTQQLSDVTEEQQQAAGSPSNSAPSNGKQHANQFEEDKEGGWTTVSARKSARKHKQQQPTTEHDDIQQQYFSAQDKDEEQEDENNQIHRDGNPPIPSTQ